MALAFVSDLARAFGDATAAAASQIAYDVRSLNPLPTILVMGNRVWSVSSSLPEKLHMLAPRMPLYQAEEILALPSSDGSVRDYTLLDALEARNRMMRVNEPSEGGSSFLCAKIATAHDTVERMYARDKF
jgi:hypothetical protein